MCTSLTYTAATGHHFFARTMDFPTTTPWRPVFLPRNYHWHTALGDSRTTRYALLGGGRIASDFSAYLMADGVNETGITCAELYLPGAVDYADDPVAGQINLTPQDFINWVLGEHATLAEVVADLPQVTLVGRKWGADRYVYPFHWILSDRQGQTLVIEPTGGPLTAQSNAAGVLTNTPVLATHLQNLNDFLQVPGATFTAATRQAAQTYLASGQPLPAGPVPTRRFIHMALRRWGTPPATTTTAATTQLFRWLAEVQLPYDPLRRHEGNHNYTHYRGVIDLDRLTYNFIPRTTHRLQQIKLTPEMVVHQHFPHAYPAN
ncbi:linear amide C-N hydrolase [Levilactobacillus angrenensis]|uniref:Linear amide C-N hydrolase n=1 Tax=Levilactobacillus angrenensis TaxID=2486020 RepID=A0ABW1U7I3_9LACO|nr:linear amide C-N hydrolase [Levilactobacillus angrenensis]